MVTHYIVLVALLLAPALLDRVANQEGSPNPLLGQWRIVSAEFAGEAVPPSQLPKIVMIFEKDGRWRDGDGSEATWVTDESKVPKTLELTHTSGRDKGKKQFCVFEVAGNRLTLVLGMPGGSDAPRPRELKTSKDNTNAVLFVLERVTKNSAPFPLRPR